METCQILRSAKNFLLLMRHLLLEHVLPLLDGFVSFFFGSLFALKLNSLIARKIDETQFVIVDVDGFEGLVALDQGNALGLHGNVLSEKRFQI